MRLIGGVFQKEGAESNESHTLLNIAADYDFLETYQIKMAQGRFFSREMTTDTLAVILNETAVSTLNITDISKDRLNPSGNNPPLNIIGVFKDFHLQSLHEKIRPMSATLLRSQPGVLLSVRIRPGEIEETIRFLETEWNKFVPGQPADYVFFDDRFDDMYRSEIQAGKVISSFSLLAIFIACLGLFGLASFTMVQRTKEIGIRKVMGASTSGIILLMSRQFLKWVLIANVLAWPIAYYAMNKWLQNFAFKTDMGLWIFIVSGVSALIIALLTVSYNSIKAAVANPAEALRFE